MNDLELKRRILERVEDDLQEIEQALKQNLKPHFDLVSKIAGHILFSGGKRLRPLLVVLGARLCGYQGDYVKTFSVIFEYLHAATLVHDDIIDGAGLRRGKPVAHTIWGNPAAVLVGDFLLARSIALAARTRNPKIIAVVADITENMSQGEIQQLLKKGDLELTEAEYFDVIQRKTAILFQGACHVSALLADASAAQEKALVDYGYHMGMAFQMIDDVLDYTLDSRATGKTAGTDIREGKLTLPVIRILQTADEADRSVMKEMIRKKDFKTDEFRRLVKRMEHCGALEYSRRQAAAHVRQAREAILTFASSETRDTLLDVAQYALVRKA